MTASVSRSRSERYASDLHRLFARSETAIVRRVSHYVRLHGYAPYTAPLVEDWLQAIRGLMTPMRVALARGEESPPIGMQVDAEGEALAAFARQEANRHRERGVDLRMFLGLLKYHREAFIDVIEASELGEDARWWASGAVRRFFDRYEVEVAAEWSAYRPEEELDQLRRANRELARRKGEYRTLFESLAEPVLYYRPSGRLARANRAACATFAELRGSGPYDAERATSQASLPQIEAHLEPFFIRPMLRGGTVEACVETVNGPTNFSIRVEALHDVSAEFDGLVVVLRDLTERDHAMLEREALEARLRQAQKLEAIGQLAAGVAHEINTPIQFTGDNIRFLATGMNELVEVVAACRRALYELEAELPESAVVRARSDDLRESLARADFDFVVSELPSTVEQALEGVDRVARIVHAMREFAHPGTSDFALEDVNQAVRSSVAVARNEYKHVADVELVLEPELPGVMCDGTAVRQVVLNLVLNAAQAVREVTNAPTDEKGKIRVATRSTARLVEVTVSDTGPGIPEAIRERVWEPFFTTKQVGQGTGQGLALAHRVVHATHGGEIFFECPAAGGTVFTVRLPRARPE